MARLTAMVDLPTPPFPAPTAMMCLTFWRRRFWGCWGAPVGVTVGGLRAGGALGGGRGAEGGGEVDEDFFDAGEGGEGGGDELAEAVFLGRGGGDFDGDVAFGDLDGFDLAEGDEVLEEVGILDGFEGFEDLLFGDGH